MRNLLALVEDELRILGEYETWVKEHGHESLAMAEALADGLWEANGNLRDELQTLWDEYKNCSSCDPALYKIVKSLEEATVRITNNMPNDPSVHTGEPLMICLSEQTPPVSFGEVTIAQLKFARDNLAAWNEEAPNRVPETSHVLKIRAEIAADDDLMTREQIAFVSGIGLQTLKNQRNRFLGPAAVETGKGRGKKHKWHYLEIKLELESETGNSMPTLEEAKRIITVKQNV